MKEKNENERVLTGLRQKNEGGAARKGVGGLEQVAPAPNPQPKLSAHYWTGLTVPAVARGSASVAAVS